jgi:sortase B
MSDKGNRNDFIDSVDRFSHNDINGDFNERKRAMIPSLIIRCICIMLCISVFGYAVFQIISSAYETDQANEFYDELRAENLISAVKPSPSLPESAPMLTLKEMLDSNGEYKDIQTDTIVSVEDTQRRSSIYRNYIQKTSKYPDMYGWIYVNFTDIDYPVMKGPYTNYYLDHTIDGVKSSYGSITADSSLSDIYNANVNNVIYGHCMKNGLMFRSLKTFMESAVKNTTAKEMNIEIYTKDGLYIYKVLSGYRHDDNYYAKTAFSSTKEFKSFLDKIVSRNELRVTNKYDENSRIVTLITCANVTSNDDERYVLHGVLTSFIPANQL